ncbi:VanZ family protein [Streptomyces bambusae]|uniref:VanZ family protein n=1 Tax=Streptomyces bambusae TaxID=1550616 RepID=UPI001CFF8F73|nr:VanZ family protein [Streptomyces bambusae]MCB5170467.1 VanZ family protein [Streptomyces bambusae]
MISAILNGNPWLLPSLLCIGLLLSTAILFLARRRSLSQLAAFAFGWALAGELVLTLYPVHSTVSGGLCTVNRDALGPLTTQQGLLNVALFIPVACLGTLLFRRPAVVLAASALLSVGTELLQSTLPVLGRACTSEDLIANCLGALLGTMMGVLLSLPPRASRPDKAPGTSKVLSSQDFVQGGKILATGVAASLLVGALTVTPVLAEVTELTQATREQRRTAEALVRDVWGPQARVANVQYKAADPTVPGSQGQTMVTLRDGSLSFTDGARFISGSTFGKSGPGVPARSVRTAEQSIEQATAFVRPRFPWALANGSKVTATPTAPGTGQFTVAWRERKQGALMPMRMDVVVEPDGRISAFTGRNEQGPAVLPPHRVTAQQARATAQDRVPQGRFTESELIVKKDPQGAWAMFWLIGFALPDPPAPTVPNGTTPEPAEPQGIVIVVHADTRKVMDGPPSEAP